MTAVLLLLVSFGAEPWATGPKCAAEWNRSLTAVFENAELRSVLKQLGPERQLALVLDRRIDPNQTVTFSLQQEPLRTGLGRFAETLDAEFVLTENVAYFGPVERARWLRTAIAHAEATMAADATRRALLMRKTIAWDDLATPREILDQIATAFNLKMENIDSVPHDLWTEATLPHVTPAEALTLVLIQLDLGWTWQPQGRQITFVAWQPPELIERTYQPRGKATVTSLIEDWHARLPELSLTAHNNEIVVRGRVEDHEQISKWLTGGFNRIVAPKDGPPPTPLKQRRFTLNEKNVPVRAVLQELEKSGAEIVVNEDALKTVGVDLDQTVSIQVQKATIEEFLKAVLDPVKAVADVDGLTITIRAQSAPR